MWEPRKIRSSDAIRMLPPAKRKNQRCQRQYLRLPRRSRAAKATLITVPISRTHHCVVMPRKEKLEIRALAPFIHTSWPVATEIVDSAVGTAKVSANQALNPIQKKISQSPWLQESNHP